MLLSWCGWHMQVLCNFYENVDISMIWSIWHHGETKGVPRQWQRKWCHDNIPMIWQLVGMSVQKKVWIYGTCKRWWGDPGYRVPTGRRHGKRGGTFKDQLGHGATTSISYNTCIRSMVHRPGVIPLKHAFRSSSGSVRCRGSSRSHSGRSGSSCTRVIVGSSGAIGHQRR